MLPIKCNLPQNFLNEEVRDGYTVSEKMKKVWAVEIDLLLQLLSVCKQHDIKVFADMGTLLGAIRHKGMIPWDDDIDVCMLREDYEKFKEIASKSFKHPYFFQTEETDPGSIRGHAQLRNSETTAILKYEGKGFQFNQGIFIDIFIYDNYPDLESEAICYCSRIQQLKKKILVKRERTRTAQYNGGNKAFFYIKKYVKRIIYSNRCTNMTNYSKEYKEWMSLFEKYRYERTKKLISTPWGLKRLTYDRNIYNSTVDVPFEWFTVPAPIGYNDYLSQCYGQWQKFEIGTSLHGEVFFDPEKSYKEYVKNKDISCLPQT